MSNSPTHHMHHDPMVIRLKRRDEVEKEEEVQKTPEPPRVVKVSEVQRTNVRSLVITCALAFAVVALIFLYMWSLHAANVLTAKHASLPAVNAQTPASPQAEGDIVARIGKLMLLPEGETPIIATVSNLDALKGQAFFKNARIGDIVLMYKAASRAILYSPELHKIIEVAPITGDTHP